MKIAVVTCYDQVDSHARPRTLRRAFSSCPDVEVVIVKNKHKGLARYIEVPLKIIATAIRQRPDAYVITFRGYEMLPLLLLVKGRKPLVFDEMLNAVEYLHEHGQLRPGSLLDKLFSAWYGWLLRRCKFVLADTQAHAELSSKLAKVDINRYLTIPIGADESVFSPSNSNAQPKAKKSFNVFYYGVMVKLHGLEHILNAAVELCKKYPDMTFEIGGDTGKADALFKAAIKKGARISHKPYYQFEEIADYAHRADICVGGPFGNTPQSQFVITTKTFQFLACERPVLIGRNKVNLAFKDKVNSLVVPQGDTQAIIDSIVWAYEHPKELKALAEAGRKLYDKEFSETRINRQIADLIKAL